MMFVTLKAASYQAWYGADPSAVSETLTEQRCQGHVLHLSKYQNNTRGCSLGTRPRGTHVPSRFILPSTPRGRWWCYSRFTDEDPASEVK